MTSNNDDVLHMQRLEQIIFSYQIYINTLDLLPRFLEPVECLNQEKMASNPKRLFAAPLIGCIKKRYRKVDERRIDERLHLSRFPARSEVFGYRQRKTVCSILVTFIVICLRGSMATGIGFAELSFMPCYIPEGRCALTIVASMRV
jgi:hypothetical protein